MQEIRWLIALVMIVLVLLAVSLIESFNSWRRSRLAIKRSRRSLRGERLARSLLKSYGYKIVDSQVAMSWWVRCDDEEYEIPLRLDYLVELGGREYIAEVKTGDFAPSLRTAATRRQLLEYALAHGNPEILLVDVEANHVSTVSFDLEPVMSQSLPSKFGRGFFDQRLSA